MRRCSIADLHRRASEQDDADSPVWTPPESLEQGLHLGWKEGAKDTGPQSPVDGDGIGRRIRGASGAGAGGASKRRERGEEERDAEVTGIAMPSA